MRVVRCIRHRGAFRPHKPYQFAFFKVLGMAENLQPRERRATPYHPRLVQDFEFAFKVCCARCFRVAVKQICSYARQN